MKRIVFNLMLLALSLAAHAQTIEPNLKWGKPTIEELQMLEKETSTINEGIGQTSHIITDMTVEEFTMKYDLIDINDLKGKYGF